MVWVQTPTPKCLLLLEEAEPSERGNGVLRDGAEMGQGFRGREGSWISGVAICRLTEGWAVSGGLRSSQMAGGARDRATASGRSPGCPGLGGDAALRWEGWAKGLVLG